LQVIRVLGGQEQGVRIAGITLATAMATAALCDASTRGVSPTGLFSDLRYIEEAGDLIGMEVYLVQGRSGYSAVVQCAGGEPADPVVVEVEVDGTTVSFELPKGQPECGTTFRGIVSSKGLRGRFVGESKDRWLPRKKGYWE
jgi:hypothetical protein